MEWAQGEKKAGLRNRQDHLYRTYLQNGICTVTTIKLLRNLIEKRKLVSKEKA